MKKSKEAIPNLLLQNARLERGWSQGYLAKLLDTNYNAVSRWESGSITPSPYFRQRLCEVFGKTTIELGLVSPSHSSSIVNIPHMHNPFFTGREPLLTKLHERLTTAKTAALTSAQALYGLGGIGKTQTAVEYAYRYSDDYSHVFWIRAASREMLLADFVELAQLLNLPEKDEQDQARIVVAVKQWLAVNADWLLILDNADDLPLAQEFLPGSHKGYILFTTRAQAAGAIAASVEIEKLNLRDSALLLLRQSKILEPDTPLDSVSAADRAAAGRIAKEMDGLPLGLVQAGAYVDETGCSLTDYLGLYATHRKDVLARRSRFLLDYSETVATTWSLSFQQVEQQSPAAATILRLCAFLAPDAIPEELLLRGAAELDDIAKTAITNPFRFNETMEVVRKYSLVRRNSETHMLSIHRLVQAVLKEEMDAETQRAWAEYTVRVVNAAFPVGDYGAGTNYQYYLQYYLPHVQECAMLIQQHQLHFPEAATLLYQAGAFLYTHGFYAQSEALHRQALAIREQVIGIEHPATAESLNFLAMLSRLQDNYEQAETFHRQALAIREKMLGLQHAATAESLNNLGVLYRNQGKYEQAEPLLQQALSIRTQLLGSEHSETLIIVINLAKLYLEQGKYERTEQLLQQTLASYERNLGDPEHPLIALNLHLLAKVLYKQGRYEQAEDRWKRAIVIFENTLGSEHPVIAESLSGLAELLLAQGHSAQAQSLWQRALNICEKAFGPEHPDTIVYRKHLAESVHKREEQQNNAHHSAAPPL